MRRTRILVLPLLVPSACAQPDDVKQIAFTSSMPHEDPLLPPPPDERPVVRSAETPPPISGGTLLLLDEGATAVASDPDRDAVHVVSVATAMRVGTVSLAHGDEPGRAAVDEDGLVHVVLRGAGAILSIDPVDATIVARHSTCPNPRGVAHDAGRDRVWVACAGGELVAHEPAGPIRERLAVAPDLRDVFVGDAGTMHVTRFRSAEVLRIDDAGTVVDAVRPSGGGEDREAGTAWRTSGAHGEGWIMVHQSVSLAPIDLESDARHPPYGSDVGCDGPVVSMISTGLPTGELLGSGRLPFGTLAVDVAIAPFTAQIAVAIAGELGDPSASFLPHHVLLLDGSDVVPDPRSACADSTDVPIDGQPIAVAFADQGTLVVQSREPAALVVVSLSDGSSTPIPLSTESRFDTGHDLFHQDAGAGLACASCHPEGDDDGRVWTFLPGPLSRRTQSLRVGLADTEPFHWTGDLPDFATLVDEIHTRRMGGREQPPERAAAFADWLFAIRPHRPERDDDDLVQRGRETFTNAGCDDCHTDTALAEGRTAAIAGVTLQIPSLRGVALRPPYMHDGRAPDLETAILDMLATTAPETIATAEDVKALTAFLESQ